MKKTINRRQAVLGVSSALMLPAACSHLPRKSHDGAAFLHGVASGDPDARSVVIWTRVSGLREAVSVDWYVASDAALRNVVAHGRFLTGPGRDHTVKPVVDGLEPGRVYYFQFEVDGIRSTVGRTRTLPTGHVERLVLAVASCSNYPFGWFNAYEAIAGDDDVDMVVHLGDYIYEYRARGGYGGDTGRRIGRVHKPGHETVSLDDYRIRHAQYKSDPGSIAMHGRHPIVVIWDDHESANNPWMRGAENHQLNEGDWFARRAASLQAYYEWMPIRDPSPGGTREQYWRHFRFGDLASLVTLESRHTGRSEQLSWSGKPNEFGDAAEARAHYDTVVGAPDRHMLSREMEAFLADGFAESTAAGRPWRIVGNQSVMARRNVPALDDPYFDALRENLGRRQRGNLNTLTRLGELGLPDDLDAWDGYPAARERFYSLAKDAGARDLLVLSGDSHGFWANELYDSAGDAMGVELGTTGITSPRSLLDFGADAVEQIDWRFASDNREIVWTEGRYRGFIRLDVSQTGARADYIAVSNVETRDYDVRTIRSFDIAHADGSLRYA